ncbi:MAG: MG2 domain-containing protein [Candidatus Hydrogenedentota bacterium]
MGRRTRRIVGILLFGALAAVAQLDLTPKKILVADFGPVGQIRDLAQARTIHVTFDQEIVPIELPSPTTEGPLEITPRVKGKFRWSGSRTLTFVADTMLPAATSFRIRVPRGLRALEGAMLDTDFIFHFETPRPTVTSVFAGQDAQDMTSTQEIFVLFNNAIDVKRIAPAIRVRGHDISVRAANPDDGRIRGWQSGLDHIVVISPKSGWAENAPLELIIDTGARGAVGSLGLRAAYIWRGKTAGPLSVLRLAQPRDLPDRPSEGHPLDQLHLVFSSRVEMSELMKHLVLDPRVNFPEELREDNTIAREHSIPVELKPGTVYTLTIGENLASIHGALLGTQKVIRFRTRNLPSRISMLSGHATLDIADTRSIRAWFTNVDSTPFRIARVSVDEFLGVKTFSWQVDTLLKIGGETNIRAARVLPLRKVIPAHTQGFVRVRVGAGEQERDLFLQITGLGVTGKFSPDSTQIFVTRLKGAIPLRNAAVTLVDSNGNILWRGATDATGIARAPGWNTLLIDSALAGLNPWEAPQIRVIVSTGDDTAVLSSEWSEGIEPWRFSIWHEGGGNARELRGTIFSDRGIYRPGELVRIKGVLRIAAPDGLPPPPATKAAVRIASPSYEDIFFGTCELTKRGGFDLQFRVPASAPLGVFTITAAAGDTLPEEDWEIPRIEGSFRVAEYRPTRIKTTVTLPAKPGSMGRPLDVKVSGRSLVGTPLSHRPVHITVEMHPRPPTPAGYPDYSFTPDRRSLYEPAEDPPDGEEADGREFLLDADFKLDAEGFFATSVTPPHKSRGVSLTDAQLTVEATVEELSHQTSSGRSSMDVERGRYMVGVKADDYFGPAGKPMTFRAIVLNREEKAVSGRSIRIRMIRRTWVSQLRNTDAGPEWVSRSVDKIVSTRTLRSGSTATKWTFTPREAGYYIAVATVTDERKRAMQASFDMYVHGGGASWWQSNDDRVDLIPDKKSYKPGDVARIIVRSPFARARAWITTEREGVIGGRVTTLEGNTPVIEVRLGVNDLPNVYIGVVLINASSSRDAHEIGRSPVRLGLINLPVEPSGKRLSIGATTDKSEYRPGETVTLTIHAEDHGEITVAVVDEGVVSLINYRFPDPMDRMYGHRAHHVTTADLRTHLLGGRNLGEKGEEPSADGGGRSRSDNWTRKHFDPTAAWFPAVELDASGKAVLHFTLPDALTTFRVLVFANGENDRFGVEGSTTFIVKRPIILEPMLPRFVRPGDTFTAGVLVRNLSGVDGDIGVDIESPMESHRTVRLAADADTVVQWQFRAPGSGELLFRWKARLGDRVPGPSEAADAVEISIPIIPPRVEDVAAASGSVVDSEVLETIRIGADIERDHGGLNVEVSTSALVRLAGATEYLFTYPYGCLEQRTSAVTPMIEFGDVAAELGLVEGSVRDVVRKYLDELETFRARDGGFGFWPGSGGQGNPWLTALVIKTMVRARQQGYAVDARLLDRATTFMKTCLAKEEEKILLEEASCLEALAEAGLVEPGMLEPVFARRDDLSVAGAAALYRAALLSKADASITDELRRILSNAMRIAPASAHFENDLGAGNRYCQSDVTATAAALEAFLDAPEPFLHAEKVVKWLAMMRKNGRWRTTRENGAVAAALGKYYRRFESQEPNLSARVTMAGHPGQSVRTLIERSFRGRSTDVADARVAMPDLATGDNSLRIAASGAGRLYFEARLSGRRAPGRAAGLPGIDAGFAVERTLETLDGAPVDPENLEASRIYRVRIAITTNENRHFVVLDSPLPAGLEPIDLSLDTERSLREAAEWTGFNRKELRDDRLLWFADDLGKGRHVLTALVRSTAAGTFEWPATRAEQMYEPEVYGRNETARAQIR